MPVRVLLGLTLVLTLGCSSGPRVVPVSGKVTLDGKPLADATVSFLWVPGPGEPDDTAFNSAGKTNASGEYTLSNYKGQSGAVVGKYKVQINAIPPQAVGAAERRRQPGEAPPSLQNKVPSKYNTETTLEFDVPSGGTSKANFDLKSN